jgi:hypothetical protein
MPDKPDPKSTTADPYEIRLEAERIIGEDRVPTPVLADLLAQYGDEQPANT